MTARFVFQLAVDEGRRDGAGVGDRMAASIAPCAVAHFVAQRTTVEAIA
ncbi:hypothetical protein [Burkholderia territorii]|nr:hypothetical protein [Burkholderia territorii]